MDGLQCTMEDSEINTGFNLKRFEPFEGSVGGGGKQKRITIINRGGNDTEGEGRRFMCCTYAILHT